MQALHDKYLRTLGYLVAILALWGCLGGLNRASAEDLPTARELLERLQDASHKVSYTGRRMFSLWLPERTLSREEHVVHQADGEHRVIPVSPGKFEPPWHPLARHLEQFRVDRDLLMQNYRVEITQGDEIAGRPTYQVHIVSQWEGRPSKKFWMDRETGLPLRMEHYDAEGTLRAMFVYSSIDYDEQKVKRLLRSKPKPQPAPRPPRFRRHPGKPPGEPPSQWNRVDDLELLREIVRYPVVSLRVVPKGFVFRDAEWMRLNKGVHIQLRYTDGLTTLSLFQRERRGSFWRRPPGPPPQVEAQTFEIEGTRVSLINGGILRIFNWSDRRHHFTLISELSQSATLPIIRALLRH